MTGDKIIEACRCGRPLDFLPVIDGHCHLGKWPGRTVPDSLDFSIIKDEIDAYGIDLIWVTTSAVGRSGDLSEKNDIILQFMEEVPGRAMILCALSSYTPERNLSELERCYRADICVGAKMHRYNQPSYKLTDSWLQPIFEFLNKRNLVFLNHTLGDIEELRIVLNRYPDITFIEGHHNEKIIKEAQNWSNLYCSSCAGLYNRTQENAMNKYGVNRYLLGSDFSSLQAGFGIGPIAFAHTSYENKVKVLGQNTWDLMKKMEWYQKKGCPERLKKY